jgi:hypothetical protein
MSVNHIDATSIEKVAPLYERVKKVIPDIEWPIHAPHIAAIDATSLYWPASTSWPKRPSS